MAYLNGTCFGYDYARNKAIETGPAQLYEGKNAMPMPTRPSAYMRTDSGKTGKRRLESEKEINERWAQKDASRAERWAREDAARKKHVSERDRKRLERI